MVTTRSLLCKCRTQVPVAPCSTSAPYLAAWAGAGGAGFLCSLQWPAGPPPVSHVQRGSILFQGLPKSGQPWHLNLPPHCLYASKLGLINCVCVCICVPGSWCLCVCMFSFCMCVHEPVFFFFFCFHVYLCLHGGYCHYAANGNTATDRNSQLAPGTIAVTASY